MGSLWSSALAVLAPAVLASPVFVETAAPSIPTRERFFGHNRLTKHDLRDEPRSDNRPFSAQRPFDGTVGIPPQRFHSCRTSPFSALGRMMIYYWGLSLSLYGSS